MTYKDGQKVKVPVSGITVIGTILSKSDFSGYATYYWVRYEDDVSLFSDQRLDEYNSEGLPCTCGTAKYNISDRHSHWCDSL